MEETNMRIVSKRFAMGRGFRLTATATAGLAILVASCTASSFAQEPAQQTFPTAEAASDALFLAAQSVNEQVMVHILAGGKELVSSGDEAEDKIDREQFVQKYRQMHRLVRQSDGTTVLYVGAENWPFPVPLVSRASGWYFDAKAGAQEIRFRRLGENESTAIEICHALVQSSKQPGSNTTDVDRVAQYARSFINPQPAQISSTPSNREEILGPFHGYYFRILTAQRKGGNGSDSKTGFTVMGYPADYRSSGVMTFIVTQNDVVYETDLGPSTADVVKAMTSWKQTSDWHVAE
jgi:hypothetical protein